MRSHPNPITAEEIRDLVGVEPFMLEIGAHDGSDTVKFFEAMPRAQIECFEPDPRPRERFLRNIQAFPEGPIRRSTLWHTAVTDTDGMVDWHASTGRAGHMEDWDYSGSVKRPTGHLAHSPEIGFKEPTKVHGVRLDTWLRGRAEDTVFMGPIDFIWADIQGAQREMIAGAPLALALTRYLYIECHRRPLYAGETTPAELIDLLPGFEPLATYGGDNILFKNRHPI